MLSLKPRPDLFKFNFPRDMFPAGILEKYDARVQSGQSALRGSLDWLNESVKGISLPGLQIPLNEQESSARNMLMPRSQRQTDVEAATAFQWATPSNPLSCIERQFNVTMRLNNGLLNYYMLYETAFHYLCRDTGRTHIDRFHIDVLGEDFRVESRVVLSDLVFTSIDGLEMTFDQTERESRTFTVGFAWSNIDFDLTVR